jgi:translocation and assembly module TamA
LRKPTFVILPEIIAPVTIYAMKHSFVQRTAHRFAYCAIFGAMLLALSAPARADNYSVQVDAPKDIKVLLETYLDIVRYRSREDIRDAYLDFLVDHVSTQAAGLLATKGYFNSRITVIDDRTGKTVGTDAQISGEEAAIATRQAAQNTQEPTPNVVETPSASAAASRGHPSYTIKVELGEQAKIRSAKLTLEGLIKQQNKERAGELEFDWSLQEDEPFTQDEWAVSKTLLLRKVRADAYASARFKETSAMIDEARKNADVSAVLDSGPYFTLGDVAVTGLNRYRENIVKNINTIEVGEAYNRQKLLDYQKSLQDLPYFSSVIVDIDANPNDAQLTPIKVSVVELPSSNFKTVVGYGTDAGFHTKNSLFKHQISHAQLWPRNARIESLSCQRHFVLVIKTYHHARAVQAIVSSRSTRDVNSCARLTIGGVATDHRPW